VPMSDPDKEDAGKLKVSATGLPQGATLSSAGQLSWKPTYEQAGNYTINVTVTDAGGLTATGALSVTVTNVNRKPTLNAVSAQSTDENKALTFSLTATDPDKEDDGKLQFSGEGLPSGATVSASGQFNWTPGYDQSGTHDINFKVRDAGGLEDTKSATITVNDVNRAPRIDAPGNKSVEAGQSLSFSVSANDPDREDQGNLSFSASGLPAGASLNNSGSFSWTPSTAGSHSVTVTVRDRGGLEDSATFTVEVKEAASDGQ